VIAYVMWASQTGSLKVDHGGSGARGSEHLVTPP
jgi:hypothetical protein